MNFYQIGEFLSFPIKPGKTVPFFQKLLRRVLYMMHVGIKYFTIVSAGNSVWNDRMTCKNIFYTEFAERAVNCAMDARAPI